MVVKKHNEYCEYEYDFLQKLRELPHLLKFTLLQQNRLTLCANRILSLLRIPTIIQGAICG